MKQSPDLRRLLDVANLTDSPIEESIKDFIPMPGPIMEAKPEPDIIVERNKTHGEFGDNARVSQSIKRILRAEPGWDLLTDTEREAMDMIALKFSRLLSGKALELQHWEDVVGYARLAEKLCKGVN